MTIDLHDPEYHGTPLWVVYGPECAPSIVCAQLLSYDKDHHLVLVGQRGERVRIWGWSVYRGEGGFRTLGVDAVEWKAKHEATFYASQDAAFARLRYLTTPSGRNAGTTQGGDVSYRIGPEDWYVLRRHVNQGSVEYIADHRGGTGNDVITWTTDRAKALPMSKDEADAYVVVSFVRAEALLAATPSEGKDT